MDRDNKDLIVAIRELTKANNMISSELKNAYKEIYNLTAQVTKLKESIAVIGSQLKSMDFSKSNNF